MRHRRRDVLQKHDFIRLTNTKREQLVEVRDPV
jgi:hypothetical protein